MISSKNPICSGTSLTVNSCVFNTSLRQLTITYEFSDGSDHFSATTFTVRDFKNPVSTRPKTGFYVSTYDTSERIIALSDELTLSGITDPAGFRFVTFNFEDTDRIGEYSTFKVNIAMEVPVEQTCFVRIDFP